MNSAWAIVIGAAIALVGSIGAPWVKEAVERKSRRAESRREQLRLAIEEFIEQVSSVVGDRAAGHLPSRTPALSTATRIALLLDEKDAPVEQMLPVVVIAAKDGVHEAAALGAFQAAVHPWFRGDISSKTALDAFVKQLENAGAVVDRSPTKVSIVR
jgi:hypothetical protein